MNWNDIWQMILTVIGAIGGSGVVIVGLSSWLGNIWASRLTEKYRMDSERHLKLLEAEHSERLSRLDAEHSKALSELEKRLSYEYESRLETQKQALQVETAQNLRFLEKQFDLYIALWDKLQELRFAGANLWQEASQENLAAFAEAYQQVRMLTEKASIVMNSRSYQHLQGLLQRFERFRIGKRELIELHTKSAVTLAYNESVRGGSDEYFRREIEEQIRRNDGYRQEYEDVLEQLRQELQERLATAPHAEIYNHMMRRR